MQHRHEDAGGGEEPDKRELFKCMDQLMGRLPWAWQTNCSLVCHARRLRPSKLLSTSGTGMSAAVSALTRKYGSAPPADVPRTIPLLAPPVLPPAG